MKKNKAYEIQMVVVVEQKMRSQIQILYYIENLYVMFTEKILYSHNRLDDQSD